MAPHVEVEVDTSVQKPCDDDLGPVRLWEGALVYCNAVWPDAQCGQPGSSGAVVEVVVVEGTAVLVVFDWVPADGVAMGPEFFAAPLPRVQPGCLMSSPP